MCQVNRGSKLSRSFRFGCQASSLWRNSPEPPTREGLVAAASRTEELGYDTFCVADHLWGYLAPIPVMMAVADVTSRLRIGTTVFNNDFHNPVVLASELATMDILSAGRIEIGLGAGWDETDYRKAGVRYDPPGMRISRLIEALDILELCFKAEPFDFPGEHYHVSDHTGFPKPSQPRIPVLIGGGGPRMLRIAARRADIVGLNFLLSGSGPKGDAATFSPEALDEKVRLVRSAAPNRSPEFNLVTQIVDVTDGPPRASAAEFAAPASRKSYQGRVLQNLDPTKGEVESSPYCLVGTVKTIIDDLQRTRDRFGVSYITIPFSETEQFAPIVEALSGK